AADTAARDNRVSGAAAGRREGSDGTFGVADDPRPYARHAVDVLRGLGCIKINLRSSRPTRRWSRSTNHSASWSRTGSAWDCARIVSTRAELGKAFEEFEKGAFVEKAEARV